MKAIMKSLLVASLLLTTNAASAQSVVQDIEDWMSSNISRVLDAKIDVKKSLGQERNVQQEGAPLKWRYDTYTFTLPKKQRKLFDAMVQAFEANGHDNPYCYSINSMTTGNQHKEGKLNLMIGEDVNRYVTLGEQYGNYINVNILDVNDATKTHRYAYALEWKEDHKGKVFVRYIVTYAKIPSAKASISVLDLGKARVDPFNNISVEGPVRFQWQGKDYPIEHLDSLFRNDEERIKQERERIDSTLADIFLRLQQGKGTAANDFLGTDNILLLFSQLKKQFYDGNNKELNAVSIYSLCKRAREKDYFINDAEAKEFLIGEIESMVDGLSMDRFKSARGYLELAIAELEKIKTH